MSLAEEMNFTTSKWRSDRWQRRISCQDCEAMRKREVEVLSKNSFSSH
jgi:hypothetical protein